MMRVFAKRDCIRNMAGLAHDLRHSTLLCLANKGVKRSKILFQRCVCFELFLLILVELSKVVMGIYKWVTPSKVCFTHYVSTALHLKEIENLNKKDGLLLFYTTCSRFSGRKINMQPVDCLAMQ